MMRDVVDHNKDFWFYSRHNGDTFKNYEHGKDKI